MCFLKNRQKLSPSHYAEYKDNVLFLGGLNAHCYYISEYTLETF